MKKRKIQNMQTRKLNKDSQKRIFAEGKPRTDVINMKEGNRSLSISSVNPDNFILETTK